VAGEGAAASVSSSKLADGGSFGLFRSDISELAWVIWDELELEVVSM
jgi:hypothetical protein